MKTLLPKSLAVAGLVLGGYTMNAATLDFQSISQVSNSDSAYTVSVFPGDASYTGVNSGTFGDGTVEAYYFNNNAGVYASGGSILSAPTFVNANSFGDLTAGDVWTTNDPDSESANFGGSTETVSGRHDVDGTIDISGLTSGTIYIFGGAFQNALLFDLEMTGAGQTTEQATNTAITTPNNRNLYVAVFTFDNAGTLYDTISYNFDNSGSNATNRARFLGVVVDGVPEPGSLALMGLGGLFVLQRRRRS